MIWRWALTQTAGPILLALMLFGGAGTVYWPAGWLYWAVSTGLIAATDVILVRYTPDLTIERSHIVEGSCRWDIPYALVLAYGPLLAALAAGLQHRLGALPSTAPWGNLMAIVLLSAGTALALWAMLENRFFSGVVRLQTDRGHTVISSGPYAWVRHPGYMGAFMYHLGLPMYFASWPALVVIAAVIASTVVRTAREDRTLQAELDGYAAYAQRVRYRLVPGVW